MSYRIEQIVECETYLGESPVWDVETGIFWWVDGTGQRKGKNNIFRLDPRSGKIDTRAIANHDIGALAIRKNGGLVLALDDGFYFYDFDGDTLDLITPIEEEQPRSSELHTFPMDEWLHCL